MLFRFHRLTILFCLPTLAALCAGAAAQTANIDATAWHVSKSSGNVWVINAGVQPVSQGDGGLSLSGAGVLAPIEHGAPRPSPVPPLPVPSNGLSAPNDVPAGQRVHMLRLPNGNTHADATGGHHAHVPGAGRLHIGSPLGELKLDIHRVTHGLARGSDAARGNAAKLSVWSSGDINAGNGVAKNYNQGNNGSGSGTGSVSGATSGSGNAGGVASAGGNGNGNAGNSNGQDNGNGNGNANGNGANNTNGNGKKNGHNKG